MEWFLVNKFMNIYNHYSMIKFSPEVFESGWYITTQNGDMTTIISHTTVIFFQYKIKEVNKLKGPTSYLKNYKNEK